MYSVCYLQLMYLGVFLMEIGGGFYNAACPVARFLGEID